MVKILEKYLRRSKVITSLKSYIFHDKVYQRTLSFCRYSSTNFSMDFGRVSFENTSQSYVAFDKINFQTIIIAWYLNEPGDYWMKVTKISATMIQYWEVSVKYLDEIAIALVRLKKPSRGKFCKLWQIFRSAWKW